MPTKRLRLLRDPILLFVVLGLGLAALHLGTRPAPPAESPTAIVVTDADVAWLEEAFRRTRMRPPTDEELRGLLERHIRDELLYREAAALGLDREDAALKRRLAMKLEYLAKDVGAAVEPGESELQAWLDAHPARYAVSPRRAFEQVYLNPDKRGARSAADAVALLERLRGMDPPKPDTVGDPILLEVVHPSATLDEVRRQFGPAFADAVFQLPVGSWEGPVRSGFGVHIVRVRDEVPGSAPALEAVRDAVRNDLLDDRKTRAVDAFVDTLRAKYGVEIRAARMRTDQDAP